MRKSKKKETGFLDGRQTDGGQKCTYQEAPGLDGGSAFFFFKRPTSNYQSHCGVFFFFSLSTHALSNEYTRVQHTVWPFAPPN